MGRGVWYDDPKRVGDFGGKRVVPQPAQEARKAIDKLLAMGGWSVCGMDQVGTAMQEMTPGFSI